MFSDEQLQHARQHTVAAVIKRHRELTTVPRCLCGFNHGFSTQTWTEHVAGLVLEALDALKHEAQAGFWTRDTYYAHLRYERDDDAPLRWAWRMLAETCEKCHAEPGHWCEYVGKGRRGSFQSFHRVRLNAAFATWEESLRQQALLT